MDRRKVVVAALVGGVLTGACARAEGPAAAGLEPIVGGPCEGCEAVFEGLPEELGSRARIAPEDEPEYRHGRLRAWVETDEAGRYRFDTIRPASYPETTVPARVHMLVLEPGCCTYWLASIQFLDDPHLTRGERASQDDRGGSGLVTPERGEDGVWVVRRDVVLGENVPGYPAGGGR